MVITVEPGIYVPPLPQFPKHFHDLSVRIEDEVVIGEDEPTVLSVSAPKEVCSVPSRPCELFDLVSESTARRC
jgi:intermediate cleaving peptidase 55